MSIKHYVLFDEEQGIIASTRGGGGGGGDVIGNIYVNDVHSQCSIRQNLA